LACFVARDKAASSWALSGWERTEGRVYISVIEAAEDAGESPAEQTEAATAVL
jgi:hypothetical protein